MNLEDELRAALRRTEPPAGFTERVLGRVAATPVRPAAKPWTKWVAALAASVILAAGAFEYRQYQGERAKSQVLLAVRIAAAKLNKAQKKVQMLNHRSNS
jgi:hypothetical protein